MKAEINVIQDKVDADTWAAIEAVRKVGNIGAHMEKDIDLMVEVDPDEARLLIWLIETLVKDWYITREERASRLRDVVDLAERKEVARRASIEVVEASPTGQGEDVSPTPN